MNKRRVISALCGAVAVVALLTFAKRNDFGLGRNMEITVNMMRELSTYYVDDVDADRLMEDAAAGMVQHLDPYTTYMPEKEMSNFEFLTTGKYGGVGSLIRKKGDYIILAQPYKGSPADRAGLKIGDKILAINGEDAKGFSTEQVSSRLKGDPNTSVKVKIERLIDGSVAVVTLKRERIVVPGVPYDGVIGDKIGYIQHMDFTEGCYDEMRAAVERLKAQGINGLILDYRDNGGGIMQEAVKIVSLFVPKGTEVVTTKGRMEKATVYKTTGEPILSDTPIVVLVNGNTASAAEIVSGALQDLDRAVVIGQRSFGKGLVQTTRPLGYNTFLKLTTAKYYIPSGRCIQAVDYSSMAADGTVKSVPDSLIHEFKTRNGRKVYDGCGIMPDVRLEPQYISRFAVTLYTMGFIEDFVDEYVRTHRIEKIDNRTFSITDADYADFERFMADKNVPYESTTRLMLNKLKEAAKSDRYTELTKHIEGIAAELKDDKATNLNTYRKEIIDAINSDIVLRHSYAQGVVERNLVTDPTVKRATELLKNSDEYKEIVTSRDTERK